MGVSGMDVQIGRVYDHSAARGRTRVLVDRLWPRGIRKEAPPWDLWLKEAAPSAALRTWYHANPEAVEEFRRRYREELSDGEAQCQALERLRAMAQAGGVVLVTATRDVERSQVPVLRDALLAAAGCSPAR